MANAAKPDEKPKENKRELVRLVGADGLKTQEQRDDFVSGLADEVMAAVQAERKRQGLPPLT
jgi:hypothetical protein